MQQVAIVTGASRGIGKSIAERLADDGYALVINYLNSQAKAEELADALRARQKPATAVQASVAERGGRERLIDTAYDTWGRLDLLVNNAGITSPGRSDLLEATEENWDEVMATNLKGPFFLSQYAANRMRTQPSNPLGCRGQIINISSISAYAVSTNRADYCIAKAGMRMLTWQFAARLADDAINVYELCPGVIASDMTAPVKEKYDKLIAEGLSPIRRWGQPEDVALAVSAIATGSFPFSTGDQFNLDGGFHIRRL